MRLYKAFSLSFFFLLTSISLFSQTIDLDRIKAEEEFRWGVRAFHNGFFNEAIVSLKKSLSYKQDDVQTRLWLGRAYYQSGFNDACLSEWKAVVDAGKGTPLLENMIEILESRRGINRELRIEERWVVSGEISGKSGEDLLFRRPSSIRARKDGSFYVVGFISNEVLVIDINGVLRKTIRGGLEGFDHPFDIIEADDGSIYVSEFKGDRISRCDANGKKIGSFGSKGREPGKLLGPQYLALDEEGNVYVTDWGNRRVAKYDREGRFLLSFGKSDDFFPGFLAPTGIVYSDGHIYVADAERKLVAVFDTSGNFLTTVLEGRVSRPEGISLLSDKRFLIADSRRLVFYDVESDVLKIATDFSSLAKRVLFADMDANGNILACDFDDGKIQIVSEITGMYTGLTVMISRITALQHPEVLVDVQVSSRNGVPVVGLDKNNFIITENRIRTGQSDLVFSGYKSTRFDVSLLVDRSPGMADRRDVTEKAASDLYNVLQNTADIRVVSGGEQPVILSKPGEAVELMAKAAADKRNAYTDAASFDLGMRMSATELVGKRNRKVVFFLTEGELSDGAFRHYGLLETLNYMKNNGIVFYPIYLSVDRSNKELDFLAKETGGKSYRYFNPRGLSSVLRDLQNQRDGGYLLRYKSSGDIDFGRRFIPVEIEALLIRRSGRDELGYFGPLKF